MAIALPRMWLQHSVEYEEKIGTDENYGRDIFANAITISNVRVDISSNIAVSSEQKIESANAVVFVDSVHSTYNGPFKEQSRITFNGKQYTLQTIIPCYLPTEDGIHHWELELV